MVSINGSLSNQPIYSLVKHILFFVSPSFASGVNDTVGRAENQTPRAVNKNIDEKSLLFKMNAIVILFFVSPSISYPVIKSFC